jgi:hypothetical protein
MRISGVCPVDQDVFEIYPEHVPPSSQSKRNRPRLLEGIAIRRNDLFETGVQYLMA